MPVITPDFPCLIVYEDESLGVLLDLGDWECDVDQWYWSCDEAYLIDQQGLLLSN